MPQHPPAWCLWILRFCLCNRLSPYGCCRHLGCCVAWVVGQQALRAHQHKYVTFTDFITRTALMRADALFCVGAMILFYFLYIRWRCQASGSAMKTYFDIPSWQGFYWPPLSWVCIPFWAGSGRSARQTLSRDYYIGYCYSFALAAPVEAGGPAAEPGRVLQDTPGHLDILGAGRFNGNRCRLQWDRAWTLGSPS